jgi:NADP-dependent aldehyde dehydrogenase
MTEYFGALAIVVRYATLDELLDAVATLEPALTFSVHVAADDPAAPALLAAGSKKAGRVIVNGFPTGVGVSWSMHHGGPYPASTSALHTSVGASAIRRWLRPVCYQGVPAAWLPDALRDDNPLNVPQRVDGVLRARRED